MDFKMKHAVDTGSLAEAPLCPADHSETSQFGARATQD